MIPKTLTEEEINGLRKVLDYRLLAAHESIDLIESLRASQEERDHAEAAISDYFKAHKDYETLIASLKSDKERLEKEKADGIAVFYEEHEILPLDSPERRAFSDDWSFISHETWKRDANVEKLTADLEAYKKAVEAIPQANGYLADRYDTDDKHVLHLWDTIGEGHSFDIVVLKSQEGK